MGMASLEHVHQLLADLIQQAQSGAIVPVRLAGQLEAVQEALRAANVTEAKSAPTDAAPDADADPVVVAMTDQAKFISHAIHELRTPMTSIRGYADMLVSMGDMNDMQKNFMDTIRANARRMEGLLTDVSDMSKLRGGTLRYTLKMDMFKNVAMLIEKQMSPVAESLGRTLTFEVPQGLPLLNTDGELLAKAVGKLVENGLRYCDPEKGGCGVTVSGSADGNTLVITVRDTGVGMSPEDVAQLGTVYFRASDDLVRTYKGSGLGIPVAYGIISILGGTIAVESALGAGTTFTIRLPGMG
jgi:signal transduction histidine kinase